MPALVLFGRRWRTASDDFFYSGLFNCLFSAVWLTLFTVKLWKVSQECSCDSLAVRIILGAFVVTLGLSVAADAIIAWMSTRGTIMDMRPRRHMSYALYLRVFTSLFEGGLTSSLIVFLAWDLDGCLSSGSLWILRVAAIIFAVVLVSKAFGCIFIYDTLGKHDQEAMQLDNVLFEKADRLWKRRFKMIACCCCIRDSAVRDAFKDVSSLFVSVFSDVDLVVSDVLAGLLLLYGRMDMYPKECPISAASARPNWMNVSGAAHFFKYAVGCYGWPFIFVAHPCCWFCQLVPYLRCCKVTRPQQVGSDICGCQMSSLRAILDGDGVDLVHVSFKNGVYELPFFIAIDNATESIVISIRGSLTLRDVVTDLDADSQPLHYPGVPEGFRAHRGMARAAEKLYQMLMECKAFGETLEFHREYTITIVGHSLGAGVAALIGIRLRSMYTNVRCYLYAPPGGLLSIEAARYTKDFQMAVIFGYDFIPRLGLYNLTKLKESIIQVLGQCKYAKYRVFAEGCFKVCLIKTENLEESGFHYQIQPEASIQNTTVEASPPYVPLHPPGRILHIFRNPKKSDSNGFDMCWKDLKDFKEILVTPNMLTDHIPLNLSKALEALVHAQEVSLQTQPGATDESLINCSIIAS